MGVRAVTRLDQMSLETRLLAALHKEIIQPAIRTVTWTRVETHLLAALHKEIIQPAIRTVTWTRANTIFFTAEKGVN